MGVMDPAWLSADEPQIIAGAISRRKQRVLLFGEMGIGKSTLTTPCCCLGRRGTPLCLPGCGPRVS